MDLLDSYRWFVDHGVMPNAGGRMDQDPLFVEAVTLIDGEREKISKAMGNK